MAEALTSRGRPRRERAGRVLAVVSAAGFGVLLWGGYVRHWAWTGFGPNDTLWDWLKLLALPIALASLPVWLTNRKAIGPRRRAVLVVLLVAFAALVVAGYLVPMLWTGFRGNTLWDWLVLLVLPAVLATAGIWAERRRRLRPRDRVVLLALAATFGLVVVGGYAWGWTWTGFDDNDLWDWTELLLVPVLVPTVLVPAALAWLGSGDARGATPREPQEPPRGAPAGVPRAILAGLVGVLAIGGVLGTLLLADAPPEPERQPGREAGVAAAPAARAPCDPPGARLVVADGASRVYRLGRAVYACRRRGPAVRLGRRGGDARYRLAGARVAYVRDRCRTSRACTSAVTSLRLGAPGGARLRERFAATGGATGLELSRRGAVAVMLRGACSDGVACAPPSLYFVDEHGTRLVDSGPGLDEHSLAGDGTTVYWRDSGHVDYGLLSESD